MVSHFIEPWDMYVVLRQSHMSKLGANRARIKDEFDRTKLQAFRSPDKSEAAALDAFISKLNNLRSEYLRCGGAMEEEELLRHIKSTLPSEYNETRAILASWMGAQDTIANLKQYLHNYVSVMPNFSARTRQQAEGPNDALITTSTAACRDFQIMRGLLPLRPLPTPTSQHRPRRPQSHAAAMLQLPEGKLHQGRILPLRPHRPQADRPPRSSSQHPPDGGRPSCQRAPDGGFAVLRHPARDDGHRRRLRQLAFACV